MVVSELILMESDLSSENSDSCNENNDDPTYDPKLDSNLLNNSDTPIEISDDSFISPINSESDRIPNSIENLLLNNKNPVVLLNRINKIEKDFKMDKFKKR